MHKAYGEFWAKNMLKCLKFRRFYAIVSGLIVRRLFASLFPGFLKNASDRRKGLQTLAKTVLKEESV